MKIKERNLQWLLGGIMGFCAIGWLINAFSPTNKLTQILFFVLFFVSVYAVLVFFLTHKKHAFLLSSGFTIYLVLRALSLRDPLYIFLLVICLLSVEFYLKP